MHFIVQSAWVFPFRGEASLCLKILAIETTPVAVAGRGDPKAMQSASAINGVEGLLQVGVEARSYLPRSLLLKGS